MSPLHLIAGFLAAVAFSSACQSGGEIASPTPRAGQGANATTNPQAPSPQPSLGATGTGGDAGTGTGGGEGEGEGSDDGKQGSSKPAGPIDYPVLMLKGRGTTQCDESLPSTTQIETKLSDTDMSLNRQDIYVECYKKTGPLGGLFGAKCDPGKFQADIKAKTLGITRFKRHSEDELEKLREAGQKLPFIAIYAKSATTHTNVTYNFDKPIPVFPMPAPKARYAELAGGAMTFTANATGGKNFQVQVEMKKVGESGDIVKIQMTTTLVGVNDREVYGAFPMPKDATYHVDTKNRDIRAIDAVNWFEDENCEGSGQIVMTYQLCTKTKAGKTDTFGCQ